MQENDKLRLSHGLQSQLQLKIDINHWQEIIARMDEALLKLRTSPITNPLLGKVPENYADVISQIHAFLVKLNTLDVLIEDKGGLVNLLGKGQNDDFADDINKLSTDANHIVINADWLIVHMIDMLPRGGNQHE